MSNITVCIDQEDRVARLEKENEFLLAALMEIEEGIDHCMIDLQLVSVGIKGLRNILGTDKLFDGALKPGLVRG